MSEALNDLQRDIGEQYTLERALGSGGMAQVFLAMDHKHARQVALKVMHDPALGGIGIERFLREIRVAAKLQHPHILPVFDSGTAGGRLWYTMPYVAGETLRQRLAREGRLSVPDALRLSKDMASALAYAHARGVVHRDIKPENVLLTPQGIAVIADFGLATALEPEPSALTGTGVGVGTPGYMAPEQMLGERPVRPQADVYALGVVMHEMLAGERPFADGTGVAQLARRMTDSPPSLQASRQDVSAQLSVLVQRCLELEPTRRPDDGAEFQRLLQSADPVPVRESAAPAPVSRRPRQVALLTGVTVLIALAATVWLNRQRSTRAATPEAQRLAVLPFTEAGIVSDGSYVGDGLAEDLTGRLVRRGFQVVPHTSVLRYKQSTTPPESVATVLGATQVVLGRLQWGAETVRLSVEVMNVASRSLRWSETRTIARQDLSATAERLAQSITIALAPDIRGVETTARVTQDAKAYNYYLLGQHYFPRFSPLDLARSLSYQDSAIARDPAFTAAWLGRANALIAMASGNGQLTGRDALGPLREALDTVLVLDPESVQAHALRAHAYTWFEWDWNAAEREFRTAFTLSAREPVVYLRAAFLQIVRGRTDSALALLRVARDADPTNTRFQTATANALFYGGRYTEAIPYARRAAELDPLYAPARQAESLALSALGRHNEAVAAARQAYASMPQPLLLSNLAIVLARAGNTGAARETTQRLVQLANRTPVDAGLVLRAYAALGDTAQFLSWLDRAISERSFQVSYLHVDPIVDAMRSDPRFARALDLSGLPPR